MRFLRYGILAIVALSLVCLALANLSPVTLRLVPEFIASPLGYPAATTEITLPLFVVIFGGVIFGVALGYLAEWLRELKYRSEAGRVRREAKRLQKEVDQMKSERNQGDDVLALLDGSDPAR